MNPVPPTPPPAAAGPEGGAPRGFLRTHGRVRRLVRRITGRPAQQQLLPVLIKVYAGFSKFDGEASEDEVESSLGFMRGDYPGAVYSELQSLYRQALRETQDLDAIAAELRGLLTHDEKIQLAVQLYVLITRSTMPQEEMAAFEKFLAGIGIASEGRDLIGQLSEEEAPVEAQPNRMLEILDIGGQAPAHLVMDHVPGAHALTVFRFHNLLLLKRTGVAQVIARGRRVGRGEFLRLYEGQRVVVGEHVLDYQDLVFYLNARKGVSSTQLYLSLGGSEAPFVERERSRHSVLRIQFGLTVQVEALRASSVRVSSQPLVRGQTINVPLSGRITFSDDTSLTFAELRRRAREMGGRFNLHPGRSDYRVSNNADLLREGDILLSPVLRSELLLRIICDYENKTGELEVIKAPRPVVVEKMPVKEKERVALKDGAIISLGEGQQLRCRFSDGIIEEERNIIRQLDVRDVTHHFGRTPAVDGISFSVRRGEMICVLGPSGSGKSCLLRILAGHLKPASGKVSMNGQPLYENTARLSPFISYIPHEDAFDPLLTVEENLACAATMRSPHLQSRDVRRRVDAKLIELGLNERRKAVAGLPEQKTLSSGERKRLNIGLDMITPADVFLFDEPTSGLSSKDSEHVLEIIRGLAHNKIVFVSIHQPSARLFHMFNKAILLDDGGKMVFFGKPQDMLDYFREAWEEQLAAPARDAGAHLPQPDFHQPEFIFDVLETPLRDLSGDVLYEEDARGHMAPARRFPPEFWRDRYHTHIVMGEVKEATLRSEETSLTLTQTSMTSAKESAVKAPPRERSKRLGVMVRRAFLNRLRNRANMATTLIEAPLLATLIALVLRWSKNGEYNFASAFHIPTYLFLSLIVAMFLGLTNSADEIIRDRILLQRERNYNRNVAGFILAKVLALGAVSLLQNVIYILIGNRILEIKDMFFIYLGWMLATSLCGVGIGLLISSMVRDGKTALNIIPLILVPQIILGGALIKYEEMNKNLNFVYSIRRWAGGEDSEKERNELQVPLIGSLMPLRWSYESMLISQATLNPYTAAQNEIQDRINALSRTEHLTPAQAVQLDDCKEALVLVSGLKDSTPRKAASRIAAIMADLDAGTFNREKHNVPEENRKVSAAQVFENQKVWDLYNKAEMVRVDDRKRDQNLPKPNVFFGHSKQYTWRLHLFGRERTLLDLKIKTVDLNAIVLVLWMLAPLVMLYFVLRRQLRRV